MTLSEESFNRQCIEFVRRSELYADCWTLSIKEPNSRALSPPSNVLDLEQVSDGKLMLMKNEQKKCQTSSEILNYEYHVLYSESYEVPVMYFCVSDQNGAQVPPDKVIKRTEQKDLSMVVNQTEHPLLFRPFYMVHPCRTRDFMAAPHLGADGEKYLISWLSIVATLLGLRLDDRFGCLMAEAAAALNSANANDNKTVHES